MDIIKYKFIRPFLLNGSSIPDPYRKCTVFLRTHLLRHRAEQTFSDDEQLPKSRSIRKKNYKSIALFIEDHRNVLQSVIV